MSKTTIKMKATISNLFYIKRAKVNSKGLVPIFHRITVNGKRIEKSTGKYVDPAKWSVEGAKMRGTSEEARTINSHLDDLKNDVAKAEKHFYSKGEPVDYENLKNRLLGIDSKARTIVPIFQEHNNRIKALIKVNQYAEGTLERYETSLSHTIEFMKWKYNVTDFDITKIDHAFVMDYDFYLRTVRGCNNNTTVKYLKNFQKIVNICLDNKWLADNPFIQYKFKVHEVDIKFLDEAEIASLCSKKFVSERLSEVRDIFIFCCFTGLAYIDAKQLKNEHISIDLDGQRWIYKKRQKTDTSSNIPILPIPQQLLDKYAAHPGCIGNGTLLPVKSNQKMNSYLKEIADVCGIEKKLTFHLARYTFATTITLSNGIPIESVGKMLGHKNIRMTQHYAKVIDKKVKEDMNLLKYKLSLKEIA